MLLWVKRIATKIVISTHVEKMTVENTIDFYIKIFPKKEQYIKNHSNLIVYHPIMAYYR